MNIRIHLLTASTCEGNRFSDLSMHKQTMSFKLSSLTNKRVNVEVEVIWDMMHWDEKVSKSI